MTRLKEPETTSQSQPVGARLRRVDAREKSTGETRFATDLRVPGMLYAYPVFSRIPSGTIRRIDLTSARQADGFIDAIFAEHIPGKNLIELIVPDQPVFASERVRYIGDTIGLVVAETEEQAVRISCLVDVEYNEIEPVLSIEASRAVRANFIHESNIACKHQVLKGDVEQGFARSDRIIESHFATPYQEHFYLEPQCCLAIPEADGGLTIHGSLQCVFYVRRAVSTALALDPEMIRVIQAPTGGAFGGKEDVPSEVCVRAALAARILQRPVKMTYRRRDDVQATSKRHPFEMRYRVGVTHDGMLLAAEIELHENAGAYATLSSVVSYRAAMQAMGLYVVPNVRMHSTAWYTNLPPTGAFRGFGSPQAAFGCERMMDVIAAELGIDPIELRLKNVLEPGGETTTGHRLQSSVGAGETILRVRDAAKNNSQSENAHPDDRYRYGTGIAATIYGNCLGAAGWHMDGAGARIEILRDGSVEVAFGLVEMGQGALTVVAQMTAEALGISPDRVRVLPTTTMVVPDSGPSVASRNVLMTGNAIRDAVSKLLPTLKSAAGELLNCESNTVEIKNDVALNRDSGQSISFDKLAEYVAAREAGCRVQGWWHVPELKYDPATGLGEAYFTYSFATHLAHVRVDTVTGLVQVEKIWAAHDVGKAINPAGIEGQVEGGVVQGLGWALTENFQIKNGKVTTPNLSTYLLPTAMDIPAIETLIVEDPEPKGPWGAKGIGEPAIIPTAAAVANAVSDALGIPFNEIPITPECVLRALNAQNGAHIKSNV